MYEVPTIRVKASDPAQGDFIIINEADFDPAKYERYEDSQLAEQQAPAAKMGIADIRAELTARGIAFADGASKADLRVLLDAAK